MLSSRVLRLASSQFVRQMSLIARKNVTKNLNQSAVRTLARPTTVRFYSDDQKAISFEVQDYDDFQDRVVNSDSPVVVQFHASWCGPCKMLSPRLEGIVANREGRVLLARIDIDENTDLALDYGVQAVPTVMAFKSGEQVDTFVGDKEDEQINAFVNNLLNE